MHTGFLEAFAKNRMPMEDRSEGVEDILALPEAKDDNGEPMPLFITGHSLGGAASIARDQVSGAKCQWRLLYVRSS